MHWDDHVWMHPAAGSGSAPAGGPESNEPAAPPDDEVTGSVALHVPSLRRLGIELRRRRRELGMSQRQLTCLLGLSARSNLSDYELGRRVPPADIVASAESVLGLRRGHLMALRQAALSERALREATSQLQGAAVIQPAGGGA